MKRLGRFFTGQAHLRRWGAQELRAGWQYLRVALDDHSRLVRAEVLIGHSKDASCAFLKRCSRWFEEERGRPVHEVC